MIAVCAALGAFLGVLAFNVWEETKRRRRRDCWLCEGKGAYRIYKSCLCSACAGTGRRP